ncbi:MAG TPA: ATP-binding cassette domain-containing protein [Bacteroidales bacterium]|nr:ATP-binding cassette domain-containing protein [Bacteroidales bacterium]
MEIKKITIFGGYGKNGSKESVNRIDLKPGDIVSIVGPTGCGKTTLINDIELFANKNTPSGRQILINDEPLPDDFTLDPSKHPIALISQHTNFLSDLPVGEFLSIHAKVRGADDVTSVIEETIQFANQLTGEAIIKETAMTELSGGQTRSLLIADAVVIGNSPIILLDEIENAGIHKTKALELLKKYAKLFVFVTHDPTIALYSDCRIIMKSGAMQKLVYSNPEEQNIAMELRKMDDIILYYRGLIRSGEIISRNHLETIN